MGGTVHVYLLCEVEVALEIVYLTGSVIPVECGTSTTVYIVCCS